MKIEDSDGKPISIYPTNKCFDDSLDFLGIMAKEEPERLRAGYYILVHGILTNSEEGYQYSHAWVETKDGEVIHSGVLNNRLVYCHFSVAEYYKEMGLIECTRYSAREASDLNHKHVNYGPWEEKYLKLCRNWTDIEQGKRVHSYERGKKRLNSRS